MGRHRGLGGTEKKKRKEERGEEKSGSFRPGESANPNVTRMEEKRRKKKKKKERGGM